MAKTVTSDFTYLPPAPSARFHRKSTVIPLLLSFMAGHSPQSSMELERVDALVNSLASVYESGLDFYLRWKRQLESQNHYRRHEGSSPAAATQDAVSTSLDMSSHRIRATYQVGLALIGPDFSAGDGTPPRCPRD
jgi:hypothetical protein